MSETGKLVLPTKMLDFAVLGSKVGSKGGSSDLVTVGTIADEGVDQSWFLRWLDDELARSVTVAVDYLPPRAEHRRRNKCTLPCLAKSSRRWRCQP